MQDAVLLDSEFLIFLKMFKPRRMDSVHKETVSNSDKAISSLSNLLVTLSNDTSLALYRIQDHSNNKIRKLVLEIVGLV